MGLSRRQFSREFEPEALQRLERGHRVMRWRGCLRLDLLHRCRQKFRQRPGKGSYEEREGVKRWHANSFEYSDWGCSDSYWMNYARGIR
jgi:stalled ribosome alternative rescue factor ArfA